MKYDVIVVGAGPAGLFACYSLLQKRKKLKIALVDRGKRLDKRKPSEVMCGVGGAGAFSDGKLTLTANLSHEKAFHILPRTKYQKVLDYVDSVLTDFGVDSEYYPKENEDLKNLVYEAEKNDVELVLRKARHVGTDKLKKVIHNFQEYLLENGIDLHDEMEVKDLIVQKGKIQGVKTSKGDMKAERVILAPGRYNARWLQKICDKYGIKYVYDKVEVGVRVEFPASIMEMQAKTLYEIVYKVRTKTYHDIVRTFCSCPNGMVSTEKYDGYVCVNGHSDSDHHSPNSNFAFVCEVSLTEPVENSIAYAKSIAEVASTIGGGKPILQSLEDLHSGRRSTPSRLEKSFVQPSLKKYTAGDISMALPYRVVMNIMEGLEILDKVMPGINSGSTLLYAPEVKFRSSKVKTNKSLQTSVKGLHVAGDAAGLSGSITGAAVTGVIAGRGIR
jgi:uncharacterized FAD-dependent dehydrogenase